VTHLRGRFGGHSVREAAMDPDDPAWREKYQELRMAFAAIYGQATALAA
jgi:hypothetical protein